MIRLSVKDGTLAILGATSHIAKNLIVGLAAKYQLSLFARSPQNAEKFVADAGIEVTEIRAMDEFFSPSTEFDAVINCVGVGRPEKIKEQGAGILFLTERFDNIILDFISHSSETKYINFSSGAIYGPEMSSPSNEYSDFKISLNAISVNDAYRVAKLHSETKHRSLPDARIIDLRIFSFFSRYIDLRSSYLVSDMVRSVISRTAFLTTKSNIMRDFVAPSDLAMLVDLCINAGDKNMALDVYSLAPVSKNELIAAFQERYGMTVSYRDEDGTTTSSTGKKSQYYSVSRKAESEVGYRPQRTSLQAIIAEADNIIDKHSHTLVSGF